MVEINYMAVIVAAIVNMVLGYVWYGPLFGKQWMALSGVMPQLDALGKPKGMTKKMVIMFVGALVMAVTLFKFIAYASGFLQQSGAALGLSIGFCLWLGFIAPVTLSVVLWEGKSWKLWFLNNAYYVVLLLVNGAILASWK